MKKTILFVALVAVLASCSTPSKLISTSTSNNPVAAFKTTVTLADVKVSNQKISFLYVPTKIVSEGGYDNIINTAVREALLSAGEQYDVLMAKQTQVKYSPEGNVESVYVTGYPGTYVNWRSSEEVTQEEPEKGGLNPFSKKK